MGLFEKKVKDEAKSCCCADRDAASAEKARPAENAGVKILGGGCAKCDALESATREALEKLGMDTAIDHVKDYSQIAAYGVMSTPALVVDGRVLSMGKVLKADEVAELLKRGRG